MNKIPDGATHIDDDLNFFAIPPGSDDGTAYFWVDGNWVQTEMSDKFFSTLYALVPAEIQLAHAEIIKTVNAAVIQKTVADLLGKKEG